MKLKDSQELPELIKTWVLQHPEKGYLARFGWDKSLQKARKWNRKSDATLCKNLSLGDEHGAEVVCITFTHGFQKVNV